MNRGARHDARAAAARAIDDSILRERQQAEADGRIDPKCRVAKRDPGHLCHNGDGQQLRPGSDCWTEAALAMYAETQVINAANEVVEAGARRATEQRRLVGGPVYKIVEPGAWS